MIWLLAGLAAATFVSEDGALLTAALLTRSGAIAMPSALAAVASGIWIGDLGLYLLGRLAARWPRVSAWVERRCPADRLDAVRPRLERAAAVSIFVSRFTPGTRLPLYLAAGLLSLRPRVFIVCTAVAAIGWTAIILLGVSWL